MIYNSTRMSVSHLLQSDTFVIHTVILRIEVLDIILCRYIVHCTFCRWHRNEYWAQIASEITCIVYCSVSSRWHYTVRLRERGLGNTLSNLGTACSTKCCHFCHFIQFWKSGVKIDKVAKSSCPPYIFGYSIVLVFLFQNKH